MSLTSVIQIDQRKSEHESKLLRLAGLAHLVPRKKLQFFEIIFSVTDNYQRKLNILRINK